ncbi:hypothetical protein KDL01_38100 [Actinospica durhamensis]|uniref:Uncharacterized protein n=1 Tax=Actinospica durhamensis TaxID=1508375 RepID=A0A941EXI3_9ACTN|nr:hypothetical protein [Actinospica durhamensis]MBR7839138.1 hypothetical protein [Actinospica durhamensis]
MSETSTTQAVLVRPPAGLPDGVSAGSSAELDYRARIREIQTGFVDDPLGCAQDADRLLEDLVRALTVDLARRRRELGGAADGAPPATEQLRLAVRRYRELVDVLTQARQFSKFT